ncbi:NAD(P)H nitroreductase [soil metagenome]
MADDRIDTALAPLLERRSVKSFGPVGPTSAELDAILRAAATVPDHGSLRPWRFVVVEGDARQVFGEALAAAAQEAGLATSPETVERVRSKAFLAPALVAVVARVDASAKVPAWEQVASASCAGYAIALAADRLGLGAIWKSAAAHDGTSLRRVLEMGPDDVFLGWVNIGRAANGFASNGDTRPPVDLRPIARSLRADGAVTGWEPDSWS